MTTIALLGATGRTGQQVIAQAPARGVKIKALARFAGTNSPDAGASYRSNPLEARRLWISQSH